MAVTIGSIRRAGARKGPLGAGSRTETGMIVVLGLTLRESMARVERAGEQS
jgi:hypothetical protein